MTSAELFVQEVNRIFGWLIVAAIIILAVKKVIRNIRDAILISRRKSYLPALKIFLIEGATPENLAALKPRWPGDRKALLQLFLKAAETFKGDVSGSLRKAFEELGLVDEVLSRLHSRKWWIRAESAYQLGVINNTSSLDSLEQALTDSHREVILAASRALANAKGIEAVEPILSHVDQPTRWATLEVADIFFSMGKDVVPKLVSVLRGLSLEGQRLVIEILSYLKDARIVQPLLPYLKSADKELRAKTLRAIGSVGTSAIVPDILRCLDDPEWQIRLLACGALGQIKDPQALPALAKRLRDPEVRVRQRAIDVITSFGVIGRFYLEGSYPAGDILLRRMLAPYKIVAALWLVLASFGICPQPAQAAAPSEIIQSAKHVGREVLNQIYTRRPWESIPHPLYKFLEFYSHSVLYYFVFLNTTYLILFVISFFSILRYLEHVYTPFTSHLLRSPMTLPISLLVPAYNESAGIVESVRSYLNVQFREFEVIVINDGSTDNTFELIKEGFQLQPTERANPQFLKTKSIRGLYRSPLHPHLLVIDKGNGGKSDALNAALNLARYPLVCAVDADSILEPQALLRVVRPFMTDPDVVAVGGVVRIANGNRIRNGNLENIHLPRKALPLFQIVEYLRAFFSGRMAWSAMECLMLISGAFGLFRKDVVLACGGYRTDTVGEDMDLVVRMHRQLLEEKRPYRMVFIPDPICWTEAPETLKVLRNQRDRWQRGLLEVLWKHRVMWFNPKYGRIGLLAMPYYILVELIGPIIEFGGYVAVFLTVVLLPQNMHFLRLFFLTAILFGVLLSIGAVVLEELAFHRYPRVRQMLAMVFMASLENFGYRQINAWWRCRGIIRGLLMKEGWGTMVRKGVGSVAVFLCLIGLPATVHAEDLEALGIAALSRGDYASAEKHFSEWNARSPRNPYILGLLARSYRAQRKIDPLIETYQALIQADPADKLARERLQGLLEEWRSGASPKAKVRKSVGPEGLGGPSPQRIVYEGHSGGLDARVKLRRGLFALAGAEAVQDAQRNDTRGFTYYDMLEQIYSLGLEVRPTDRSFLRAVGGQSFLSDNEANGVGRTEFTRLRAEGAWEGTSAASRFRLSRSPRFLRGTGSSRYFAILRQHSADASLEATWMDWDWRLKGGADDYSEGTTTAYGSFRGLREWGSNLFIAQVARTQQEYYGATVDGKLGLVDYNQAGARFRRLRTERYRVEATYDFADYEDRNELHEINAEATAWLPFYRELAAVYRYRQLDYARVDDEYTSTEEIDHWVGGSWSHSWGNGFWSTFGYEHGFLFDDARRSYEDNSWKGELSWFVKDRTALILTGKARRSTLHDLSHSVQLEGRISF